MYPRIPWELVANPLGSAEHTFGTTVLDEISKKKLDTHLNQASEYGICTCIEICINVVANSVMLQLYIRHDFYKISFLNKTSLAWHNPAPRV